MAEVAFVAIVVGAALSAYGSIQEGRAIAAAEDFRQDQFSRQIDQQNLASRDEELERRREIAAELGQQAAQGVSSGFDPFSSGSSFLAIRQETERVGAADVDRIRLINANQLSNFSEGITQSKMAASNAKSASYLKAAGAITTGVVQAGSLSASQKKTT